MCNLGTLRFDVQVNERTLEYDNSENSHYRQQVAKCQLLSFCSHETKIIIKCKHSLSPSPNCKKREVLCMLTPIVFCKHRKSVLSWDKKLVCLLTTSVCVCLIRVSYPTVWCLGVYSNYLSPLIFALKSVMIMHAWWSKCYEWP